MKRRVSFLVMLILAVALVFTLSACGECEHEETATRQEVTVEGNCLTQQRYDEITYCVNCDTEISRESKIGEYGDHTPAAAVLENLDLVDCTKGGTAEKVVYCSLARCKKEISRQSTAVAATAAHSISKQLLFSEDHMDVEMIEYCSACAYRNFRPLTAQELTDNADTINKAKASAATHSYTANVCKYCKSIDSTKPNLKYTLNADGQSYTLEGLTKSNGAVPQNLRIGYYNGKPVTKIAAEAFKGLTGIRYVSIGSCVEEIGVDAFAGCRLSNLIIYDLEAWAQIKFANPAANPLSATEMFSINENIKVGANSTFTTEGIENITGTYTFAGLKASTVYISADTKTIGEGAFANSSALLYVHIDGTDAKTVGKDAFLNCKSIKVAYDNSADTNYLSVTANPAYYASAFVVDGNSLNGAVLVIKDGTKKINSYAYAGLNITGVKIPASVTEIANGAFAGCTSLATIEFLGAPASLTIGESAFKDCSAVTEVTLPQTTTAIGPNAFENCSALATVVIGDAVNSVGAGAFKGCAALTTVALPRDLTVLNSEIFANCSLLATVTLGANVEEIRDNAFLNCVSLAKFDFTDKIETVGNGAFSGCASLTELKLNSGLETIGESAFENCAKIKNVTVPGTVTAIGLGAFRGCASVETVNLPFIGASNAVDELNCNFGYIFGATVAEENRTFVPFSLENVIISGNVSAIKAGAFKGCESIVTVNLPSTLKAVGENAFDGCTGLEQVRFLNVESWLEISFANYSANPIAYAGALYVADVVDSKPVYVLVDELVIENISVVKPYAFYGATALNSLTVKDGVAGIGNDAFYGCANITSVDLPASVTAIGARAFFACDAIDTVKIASIESWCAIDFADMFANPLYYLDYAELTDESDVPESLYIGGECCTYVVLVHSDEHDGKKVALTNIVIPASVLKINAYAFAGCDIITEIEFEGNVEAIGNYAFYGCNKLTYVELPDSCELIGNSAFESCVALSDVSLGGVVTIGDRAFAQCIALTSVVIPDTTTVIGKEAFVKCVSLATLTLGSDVEVIGTSAFHGCTSLASVTIPATVTKIAAHAFCECPITAVSFANVSGWKVNGKDVAAEALGEDAVLATFLANTDFEWVRA